jgi:hypothetical protein
MPPERAGVATNPQSVISTAVTAVSTAAIDTLIDIGNARATKNLVTFDTTQDCFICFGESNMGAATSSDWLIKAGDGPVTFLLDSRRTRFYRVIRNAADGILKHYVSG